MDTNTTKPKTEELEMLQLTRAEMNLLRYAMGALHAAAMSNKHGDVAAAIVRASVPVAAKLGIEIEL